MDSGGRRRNAQVFRTAIPSSEIGNVTSEATLSTTPTNMADIETFNNGGLSASMSAVTIRPVSTKSSESDRDFGTEADSPVSSDGALLFSTRGHSTLPGAMAGAHEDRFAMNGHGSHSAQRVSSDGDCETIACSSDFGSGTTPSYMDGSNVILMPTPRHKCTSRRASPLMARIGSGASIMLGGTDDMPAGANSSRRAGFLDGVKRAAERKVGEEEVPYLTLLILRLTRSLPGAQYLVHPRVVCVLGALAVLAPGIAYTILEKLVSDDLEFHYPYFMQMLMQGMAAVLLELFTHDYGLFSRTGSIRTARMLPLAALYAVSLVLSHCARQVNSVHGTFQVAQGFLPFVVMVMMGSSTYVASGYSAQRSSRASQHRHFNHHHHYHRSSRARSRNAYHALSVVNFVRGMVYRLFDQGRNALGQTPNVSAASLLPSSMSRAGSDEDDVETAKGYLSNGSSASLVGDTGHDVVRVGRWVTIPLSLSIALAVWSPAYRMVSTSVAVEELEIGLSTSLAWARCALNIVLSAASVLVNAALLVEINEYLQQHPGLSAASFLRHFTPVCTLISLVLWPMVEQPAEALEMLTSGPSSMRISLSCVGVCTLGALSYIARTAMLRAAVTDGPVGVAVVGQVKTAVCLAIGWWSYGYAHWKLQVVGFYLAVGCLALWAVRRLAAKYPDLQPAISLHTFKTGRSRKYSSAAI
ncbi:hypothetical protein GQ54DRAFT_306035 [Martensiomyces pterosporus]|nr:hypothetical protein GQ54DRAFT_306035 [Martensiomyces pterosporus]